MAWQTGRDHQLSKTSSQAGLAETVMLVMSCMLHTGCKPRYRLQGRHATALLLHRPAAGQRLASAAKLLCHLQPRGLRLGAERQVDAQQAVQQGRVLLHAACSPALQLLPHQSSSGPACEWGLQEQLKASRTSWLRLQSFSYSPVAACSAASSAAMSFCSAQAFLALQQHSAQQC